MGRANRLFSLAGTALACLTMAFAGTAAFAACDTRDPLFYDTFSPNSLSSRWSVDGNPKQTPSGVFGLEPRADRRETAISRTTFRDVSICATVAVLKGADTDGTSVGVIFWATDANNFYVFDVQPQGSAQVFRVARNVFTTVTELAPMSLRKGIAIWNDLRVDTVGTKATLYVNGVQAGTIEGVPPANGQRIGFYAESPDVGPAQLVAKEIVVAAVKPPPSPFLNFDPTVSVAPTVPPPPPPRPAGSPEPRPQVAAPAPKPVGADGLTDEQRGDFKALLAVGMTDASGRFSFKPGTAVPDRQMVAFPFTTGDGYEGQVHFFFGAPDILRSYVQGGGNSPHVREATAKFRGEVSYGRLTDPDRDVDLHWTTRAVAGNKAEAMSVATGMDGVRVLVTIVQGNAALMVPTNKNEPISPVTFDKGKVLAQVAYDSLVVARFSALVDSFNFNDIFKLPPN
jgi:hypothetical protein